MVWDRRPERDAGARDRYTGAAHSCDAGRSGRPAQPGREWFGALERKSGAVRRSHAPRLRALPRYRQSGKAQARVTDDRWLFAEGCRAAAQPGVKAEAAADGMQHKEKHHHRKEQIGPRPFANLRADLQTIREHSDRTGVSSDRRIRATVRERCATNRGAHAQPRMPVRVRPAVHALGSSSNLKPTFCRPSTAVLPYSFSISLPKLGA